MPSRQRCRLRLLLYGLQLLALVCLTGQEDSTATTPKPIPDGALQALMAKSPIQPKAFAFFSMDLDQTNLKLKTKPTPYTPTIKYGATLEFKLTSGKTVNAYMTCGGGSSTQIDGAYLCKPKADGNGKFTEAACTAANNSFNLVFFTEDDPNYKEGGTLFGLAEPLMPTTATKITKKPTMTTAAGDPGKKTNPDTRSSVAAKSTPGGRSSSKTVNSETTLNSEKTKTNSTTKTENTTPDNENEESTTTNGGLGAGAIAGITIGCLLVVAAVICGVVLIVLYTRRAPPKPEASTDAPKTIIIEPSEKTAHAPSTKSEKTAPMIIHDKADAVALAEIPAVTEMQAPIVAELRETVCPFETAAALLSVGDSCRLAPDIIRGSTLGSIAKRAKEVLEADASLLALRPPLLVFGDTHGQFGDVLTHFNNLGFPPTRSYLFLGDLVDRGPQSVENIMLAFSYKLCFPKNYFIVRGNHETDACNKDGCFPEDCHYYDAPGIDVKTQGLCTIINAAMDRIPLVAVIGERIICMHGGLSPLITRLEQYNETARNLVEPTKAEYDTMWSDPKTDIVGWRANWMRNGSFFFGPDALDYKLKELDVDLVARGHQAKDGYQILMDGKIVTIFRCNSHKRTKLFSAPNYEEVAVEDDSQFETAKPLFWMDLPPVERIPYEYAEKDKEIKMKLRLTMRQNAAGVMHVDNDLKCHVKKFRFECPDAKSLKTAKSEEFSKSERGVELRMKQLEAELRKIPRYHAQRVEVVVESKKKWDVELSVNLVVETLPAESLFAFDLLVGDQILGVNGKPVLEAAAVRKAIEACDKPALTVNRAWNVKPVPATKIPAKSRRAGAAYFEASMRMTNDYGVKLELHESKDGKFVTVSKMHYAAIGGLALIVGDRILELNDERLDSVKAFLDGLTEHIRTKGAEKAPIRVLVERPHATFSRPSAALFPMYFARAHEGGYAAEVGNREAERMLYFKEHQEEVNKLLTPCSYPTEEMLEAKKDPKKATKKRAELVEEPETQVLMRVPGYTECENEGMTKKYEELDAGRKVGPKKADSAKADRSMMTKDMGRRYKSAPETTAAMLAEAKTQKETSPSDPVSYHEHVPNRLLAEKRKKMENEEKPRQCPRLLPLLVKNLPVQPNE